MLLWLRIFLCSAALMVFTLIRILIIIFKFLFVLLASNPLGFILQGGTLWFQNLTEYPHGGLGPIFPLMIAGLHFANVQVEAFVYFKECFQIRGGRCVCGVLLPSGMHHVNDPRILRFSNFKTCGFCFELFLFHSIEWNKTFWIFV